MQNIEVTRKQWKAAKYDYAAMLRDELNSMIDAIDALRALATRELTVDAAKVTMNDVIRMSDMCSQLENMLDTDYWLTMRGPWFASNTPQPAQQKTGEVFSGAGFPQEAILEDVAQKD